MSALAARRDAERKHSGNVRQGAGVNPVGKAVLAAAVLDVLDRQRVAAGFGEAPRQNGVAAQIDVVVGPEELCRCASSSRMTLSRRDPSGRATTWKTISSPARARNS